MKFLRKKMSQYFPKPFRTFGGNIKVKVDLLNHATKADQLDIDKLAPVPVDLSDVIKNDALKKLFMIDWLQN